MLEVSISYAGATAIAIIDELAFVNKRQDERMEGIEEGFLGLMAKVSWHDFFGPFLLFIHLFSSLFMD